MDFAWISLEFLFVLVPLQFHRVTSALGSGFFAFSHITCDTVKKTSTLGRLEKEKAKINKKIESSSSLLLQNIPIRKFWPFYQRAGDVYSSAEFGNQGLSLRFH